MKILIVGLGSMGKRRARLTKGMIPASALRVSIRRNPAGRKPPTLA